jgi:tryptophanyl-tRNA synthetase
VASAFTDPNRKRRADPGDPLIFNIYTLHGFFSENAELEDIRSGCTSARLGCVECKKNLADKMILHFSPMRQRWAALQQDREYIKTVLDQGRDRCLTIASETLKDVRHKMGLSR